MKKFLKGSSFVLYFLMIIVFFFVGVTWVIITGAAEGQGLAAGAIVIGNGVIFAFVALIASFVFVFYAPTQFVKKANIILVIALAVFIAYFTIRFFQRQRVAETSVNHPEISTKALAMASPQEFHPPENNNGEIGLGFFKPKLFDTPALYFYGQPNFMKPVIEHPPFDSLSFQQLEYGGYDISYAPPWFVPHHLKPDYDLLALKVTGVSRDFAEVIVNTHTQRTAYVNRYAGELLYWPDFLLMVNSVEMLKEYPQKVRVKPLSYAGEVILDFEFLNPVMVKDQWIKVELQDSNLQKVGEGWIKWRDKNGLLISYSLFS